MIDERELTYIQIVIGLIFITELINLVHHW